MTARLVLPSSYARIPPGGRFYCSLTLCPTTRRKNKRRMGSKPEATENTPLPLFTFALRIFDAIKLSSCLKSRRARPPGRRRRFPFPGLDGLCRNFLPQWSRQGQGNGHRAARSEIFALDQNPESIFSKAGFYHRMMALSMRDETFKVQMFRFVDVLASLRNSGDIVRHLDEYFATMRNGFAPLLHTGVRAAKIVPWFSSWFLRWNVSGMARQFISGRNPEDAMKTLRKGRKNRIGFTVDLLGEAVVSEEEADEYGARCFELLEGLRANQGWSDSLGINRSCSSSQSLGQDLGALFPDESGRLRTRSPISHRSCARLLLRARNSARSLISTWRATRI